MLFWIRLIFKNVLILGAEEVKILLLDPISFSADSAT